MKLINLFTILALGFSANMALAGANCPLGGSINQENIQRQAANILAGSASTVRGGGANGSSY